MTINVGDVVPEAVSSVEPTTTTTFEPVATTVDSGNVVPDFKYTAEDIAKARQQEKSKLYPEIETLKNEVRELRAVREAEVAAKTAEEQAAADAARAEAEQEMSAKEFAAARVAELEAALEAERQARLTALATLERDAQYVALQEYRAQALAANQDNIIPQLRDLVGGETPEQIDASIAGLIERSTAILGEVQAAATATRQDLRGVTVTSPPVGPMENQSSTTQFTPENIAAMSNAEYAQYRQTLLGDAARSGGRGLFG